MDILEFLSNFADEKENRAQTLMVVSHNKL